MRKICNNCGTMPCTYPKDEDFTAKRLSTPTWLANMDCWTPIAEEQRHPGLDYSGEGRLHS